MMKKIDNLIRCGKYEEKVDDCGGEDAESLNKKEAAGRPDMYPGDPELGEETYSTISAGSLYGVDFYASEAQRKAAEAFVQNAVANVAFPQGGENGDVVYQKTMAAIQSVAASTFVEAYTSRVKRDIQGIQEETIKKSKLQLLKEMNTAESSSSDFWIGEERIGNLGILQRALAFFDLFFALNYSLNHIFEQLEKVNLQLSLLLTQNTLLSKNLKDMMTIPSLGRKGGYSGFEEELTEGMSDEEKEEWEKAKEK